MTTNSYRVRRKHARRGEQKEYPFYPNQLLRILMTIMGAVAVIATLAALFPLPLDHIADPLTEIDPGTRSLWILKPAILLSDILSGITFWPGLTMVLIALLGTLFVLLPILDHSGQRSIKRRTLVAVPFLLWMLFLALSLILSTGVRG
jgi:quinol-cytochrome oxidoreductase complex cytochrome b subunit